MTEQQLTLLPQDRIVQRFIMQYIAARNYTAMNKDASQIQKAVDLTYLHATISSFGNCFDLTYENAERYLKEHAP